MRWRQLAGLINPAWGGEPEGKIFISYRRSDVPGIAGRLSDSLGRYFGDERVFRDIEDIQKGARFGEAIERTIESADALIVLIGPGWLGTRGADGGRRLDDPDDWVATEIAAAIEQERRVFPVLVEGAQMPRAADLPERLRPLAGYNAISLADNRWTHDVTRLAKVISFDLPGSLAERKLDAVNLLACGSLVAAMAVTMLALGWRLRDPGLTVAQLIDDRLAAINYVALFPASLLLLVFSPQMAPDKQRFAIAAGLVGFIGAGATIIAYAFFDERLLLVSSTLLIPAVLGLMSLSGFRPKW